MIFPRAVKAEIVALCHRQSLSWALEKIVVRRWDSFLIPMNVGLLIICANSQLRNRAAKKQKVARKLFGGNLL